MLMEQTAPAASEPLHSRLVLRPIPKEAIEAGAEIAAKMALRRAGFKNLTDPLPHRRDEPRQSSAAEDPKDVCPVHGHDCPFNDKH